MLRYEIRFINFGYGTITTDSWDTLEEVSSRYEEVKNITYIDNFEIDTILIFDNEIEEYIDID